MERSNQRNTEPIMSIGRLAEKVELSVSTVRKYEAEGLIIPFRAPSGHRLYSYEDLDRVQAIKDLIQEQGLNIEGIRRLVALVPCLELSICDPEKRRNCQAFRDKKRPCWMIKGNECSGQKEQCRKCDVYRFAINSAKDIKKLLYDKIDGAKTTPKRKGKLELK